MPRVNIKYGKACEDVALIQMKNSSKTMAGEESLFAKDGTNLLISFKTWVARHLSTLLKEKT